MNGSKYRGRLIAKMIGKLILGIIIVFMAVFVYADGEPEGSLTMEEFNDLEEYNFNETLLEIESGTLEDYYIFQMNIYQPFTHYYNINNETGTYDQMTLIKQQRKKDYFACPKTIGDCNSAYTSFIEEYKTWWIRWYDDLKGDYNE